MKVNNNQKEKKTERERDVEIQNVPYKGEKLPNVPSTRALFLTSAAGLAEIKGGLTLYSDTTKTVSIVIHTTINQSRQ